MTIQLTAKQIEEFLHDWQGNIIHIDDERFLAVISSKHPNSLSSIGHVPLQYVPEDLKEKVELGVHFEWFKNGDKIEIKFHDEKWDANQVANAMKQAATMLKFVGIHW